ncbi:hypothetical protein MNBD_GAMMA13-328 [hydrothermal vent metagenome]|uniref:Uncharacterized protein n=1 Tax=hydrothermal vent metagenome TaxID=652676 RepID=A0A3B0YDM3_9ZZZZ
MVHLFDLYKFSIKLVGLNLFGQSGDKWNGNAVGRMNSTLRFYRCGSKPSVGLNLFGQDSDKWNSNVVGRMNSTLRFYRCGLKPSVGLNLFGQE